MGELGGHGCVGAITVALVASLGRRGIQDAPSWIPCRWQNRDAPDDEPAHYRPASLACNGRGIHSGVSGFQAGFSGERRTGQV